jgi:hypothetical protein
MSLDLKSLLESGAYTGIVVPCRQPISFILVVYDFGVNCVGREHAEHLIRVLKEHYTMSIDWDGALYYGIQLDWNYNNRILDISMPNYIHKVLQRFQHSIPSPLKIAHTYHIPRRMGRQCKIQYQQMILTPWMQLASNGSNKSSDPSYSMLKK